VVVGDNSPDFKGGANTTPRGQDSRNSVFQTVSSFPDGFLQKSEGGESVGEKSNPLALEVCSISSGYAGWLK